MKKILALVFILVLSVSPICSAFEQPDPDRWFWIGSDDKIGFWLDSQTMEFEKELSDRITRVWVLTYTAKDDNSSKSLWEYNLDKRKLRILSEVIYNSSGDVIYTRETSNLWTSVIPGTWGETIMKFMNSAYDFQKSKKLKIND